LGGGRGGGRDDLDVELEQLPYQFRPAFVASLRISMLEREVLAFDVSV
jgi:hypothetical protein